jgi:hypothetical protein
MVEVLISILALLVAIGIAAAIAPKQLGVAQAQPWPFERE